MNDTPWPTAGLACASPISGLVIELCGKARGANWISKDFFFSTAKCTLSSLSTSTDFFIAVCDAIKNSNSMAKKYSLVKHNVFCRLYEQCHDYEKLLLEMRRKGNCTSCGNKRILLNSP